MSIVVTFGCWDLFHYGHLQFLNRAAKLGNRLYVGVASDEVIKEDKGRLPIIPSDERIMIVSSLKCVDGTLRYVELDFIKVLETYDPDILAVGEYWGCKPRHKKAEEWIKSRGGKVVPIPYTPSTSTSQIIARILETR